MARSLLRSFSSSGKTSWMPSSQQQNSCQVRTTPQLPQPAVVDKLSGGNLANSTVNMLRHFRAFQLWDSFVALHSSVMYTTANGR